jgi:hypothetical protein
VRERIRAGETREQILEEYASPSWPVGPGEQKHGADAVNIPQNRGVLRAIYVVPVVAITLGAAGLAGVLRRWRSPPPPPPPSPPSDPNGSGSPAAGKGDGYDDRLDDELKDLDD